MLEPTIQKYRVEVKARLVRCPRCRGFVTVEPDPIAGEWAVCVNCGWEQPLGLDEPIDARNN